MEKTQDQIVHDTVNFISWLRPTGLFEMRLLTTDKGMRPALYQNREQAALKAYKASCRTNAKAVYITLNPLKEDLEIPEHGAVNDNHVTHYNNLLLDFDTTRPAGGENATDEARKRC